MEDAPYVYGLDGCLFGSYIYQQYLFYKTKFILTISTPGMIGKRGKKKKSPSAYIFFFSEKHAEAVCKGAATQICHNKSTPKRKKCAKKVKKDE